MFGYLSNRCLGMLRTSVPKPTHSSTRSGIRLNILTPSMQDGPASNAGLQKPYIHSPFTHGRESGVLPNAVTLFKLDFGMK